MRVLVPSMCSGNRTIRLGRIDFTHFSVINGWNTVYDFGKRILGLASFLVFAAALVPFWAPGQSALEFRINSQNEAIRELHDNLRDVPSDIAVLKRDIVELRDEQKNTSDAVQQIRTTAFTSTAGMLVFLLSWLFNIFGGKVIRKKETQE